MSSGANHFSTSGAKNMCLITTTRRSPSGKNWDHNRHLQMHKSTTVTIDDVNNHPLQRPPSLLSLPLNTWPVCEMREREMLKWRARQYKRQECAKMQSVSVVTPRSVALGHCEIVRRCVFKKSSNDVKVLFPERTDERVLRISTQSNNERTQKPRIKKLSEPYLNANDCCCGCGRSCECFKLRAYSSLWVCPPPSREERFLMRTSGTCTALHNEQAKTTC